MQEKNEEIKKDEQVKKERKEKKLNEKKKKKEKKIKKVETKKFEAKKIEKPNKNEMKNENEKKNEGMQVQKKDDFSNRFSQTITKSELIEYYDISGCYILRPRSYSIWEYIQEYMNQYFKIKDVQNCYFPLFVSKSKLETEKKHIEGFAPEVAWVTESGKRKLNEPIAIRPTSETIMYPSFAKWIQSYRDLPLKINQWSNVVRWEFKHPIPFIRSREFLWQEGHTAYETKKEAEEEVFDILNLYGRVYEELLAVPVIKGKKTEVEKFAGGDFTSTCEVFVPTTGRGCQAATSHHLGQNFSKMFNITYLKDESTEKENKEKEKEKKFVFQNSWGYTTRSIGLMVMIHGDDKGLVLPPRVASIQVVIVPLYFKSHRDVINLIDEESKKLNKRLIENGIRSKIDFTDQRPGFKYNFWEIRGIPIRIEFGPKDLEKNQCVVCRRDTGEKIPMKLENIDKDIKDLLNKIQTNLFEKAKNERDSRMVKIKNWDDFMKEINVNKNICLCPFCLDEECEENVKLKSSQESKNKKLETEEELADQNFEKSLTSSAKSLCIPFDQPPLTGEENCFCCNKKAKSWVLFGRSY